MAIRLRQAALESYYQNPNICLMCGKVIDVKDSEKVQRAKRRKFCDHHCAATYSNAKRVKPKKIKEPRVPRLLRNTTLAELRKRTSSYQSYRSAIVHHANKVFEKSGKEETCSVCGYSKHIQVCHIKAVADFSPSALIWEVNSIDNLVGLCPNCHWEFDHGILTIREHSADE